ncbi:MAG: integrase [Paucimonas sp.]|nr:integrase [Paucimonas sp.]
MFPGRDRINPMTTRQLNRVCHMAAELAGLPNWVAPHTLRHSFAPHLLEQNIDIRVIQVLLGHSKLDTTARYTQVATNIIREVMSPLDRLTPAAPSRLAFRRQRRDQIAIAPRVTVGTSSPARWRLSDDGPGASQIVAMGRHPKPFTRADIARPRSPLDGIMDDLGPCRSS